MPCNYSRRGDDLEARTNNNDGFGENKSPKRASKGKTKSTSKNKIKRKAKTTLQTNVKSKVDEASIASKGTRKTELPSIKPSNKRKAASKSRRQQQALSTREENATTSLDPATLYIQFSRVFQRHVVYQNNTDHNINAKPQVIESYEFLDEAISQYPGVRLLAPKDLPFPPPTCSLSSDENEGIMLDKRAKDEDECETTLAGMGTITLCELEYPVETVHQVSGWESVDERLTDALGYRYDQSGDALQTLLKLVLSPEAYELMFSKNLPSYYIRSNLPRHYDRLTEKRVAMRGLTSDKIRSNHEMLLQMLGRLLEMERPDIDFVLFNFPQLCLYDSDELEEMLNFLLSPLPPEEYASVHLVAEKGVGGENVDWPMLLSNGFGAGLTKTQAAEIVRMMPEVLALYYEDSLKPSLRYMRDNMHLTITPDCLDTTMAVLSETLEGTTPSDIFFFSFVAFHGVSWNQIRMLSSSLKLWRNCDLEPSFQILQYNQVRSKFKRYEMDYLRQRLQVTPSDLQRMIKTHSRLSGYSACFKMKPTLNHLQICFGLTCRDTRKLMLRMPSIIGMSKESIDDKFNFFLNEAGMSKDQCRTALLKQPSLIQYSIKDSLQPKIDFFVSELGINPSLLPRIITTAPSLMGCSLTDNLRPKVVCLMRECLLNQFQVGTIVATSPTLLTLSIKGKIEPMLSRISELLVIQDPVELGNLIVAAPRMLHQSMKSLNGKYDFLVELLQSEKKAAAVFRNNPSLLQWNLQAFKVRLDQYTDSDLLSGLKPSKCGRQKLVTQLRFSTKYEDAIIRTVTNMQDVVESSLGSISQIYPDINIAAKNTGTSKSTLLKAIKGGQRINGYFLSSIVHNHKSSTTAELSINCKKISVIVEGSVFPRDHMSVTRGQSKTGGVCLKILNDSNGDHANEEYASLVKDFRSAAASCFAVIPNPYPSSKDILVIFPLLNASKNRCDLYALWAALRVIEALLNMRRSEGDEQMYRVQIISQSDYALKIVSNRDRMLKLGSSYTYNKELLSSMGMNESRSNVDILHPLVRSFSRISGQEEPSQSRNVIVDGAMLKFYHATDALGDKTSEFTDMLKRQAAYAAKWQTKHSRLSI